MRFAAGALACVLATGLSAPLPGRPGPGARGAIEVGETAVEHARRPLGLDAPHPRLSWVLHSARRGQLQTAYQVLVASTPARLREDAADVWNSGRVASGRSVQVSYGGPALRPRTRYHWSVRVWDRAGRPGGWSAPSWWETGLLGEPWRARWIGHAAEPAHGGTPQLRTEFRADRPIRRARLYSTALGLYELRVNGRRVGNDVLAPGWTDYNARVQYQTYDVTGLLRRGGNAIGATIAPGWYAGHVGWFGPGRYGRRPWLRAQLEIEYADGAVARVVTDPSWRSSTGPVLSSDLLMGETYDARAETPGWDAPGFDDTHWRPVLINDGIRTRTVAQLDAPVQVTRELRPVRVTEPKPGVWVFDLGQNMVGAIRLRVSGPRGRAVRIRHAEVLDGDGMLYTANLRTAKATTPTP